MVPKVKLYKDRPSVQALFVLGGKNDKSRRIDSINILDPATGEWIDRPEIRMRKAKSGFASVFVKFTHKKAQALMVIGGHDDHNVQNRVEFMNMNDLNWHKCASMIVKRDELAAVVGPDQKVYAIGGYGGSTNLNCLKSVERFDPVTNTWEEIASMNQGRRAHAAVATNTAIYAIGGYDGKDYMGSIEKYDIAQN